MDYEKEIPFGAFDSELMHQEIYIPEGFKATIKGNRIILKKIESEDEKIRKWLLNFVQGIPNDGLDFYNINKEQMIAWLEKQGEPKQEWSETDENRFQNIIACIEDCYNEKDAQDLIRWLKSFKNRVQPKQEWSDKDKEMTEELIKGCVSAEKAHHFLCTPKEVSDWLKSLKDRIIGKED